MLELGRICKVTVNRGEEADVYFDPFMAPELYEGALKGITGKFHEDPVFNIKDDELEVFEKEFPHKEKHVTDTQFKQVLFTIEGRRREHG